MSNRRGGRRNSNYRARTFVALDFDCACGSWLDRAWMHTDVPSPESVVHFTEDQLMHGSALSRIKGRPARDLGDALLHNVHQGPEPMVRVYVCNRCPARPQRSIDSIRSALLSIWEPGLHKSWRVELR